MFRKTVMAGVVAVALSPFSVSAQQPAKPADPGTSPGSSASTPATPAATPALTGNFGLYSQYVFRGLTQTDRDPAAQGGFDYAHASGFYAGTWASNISWLRDGGAYRSGGSLEWDFYGGYKLPLGDFGLDIGTLYYWYPGNATNAAAGAPSNPKANTWEVYGAVSWKWLSAKYSHSVMSKTFAVKDSSGTWYLDLTASVPLGDFVKALDGVTFIAHYGKQKYDGSDPRNVGGRSNNDLYSYDDWKIGLSYTLPQNFTVGAFYTDTNSANPLGYGSVGEGGVFPRNIAKSTGTVFVQKTF
jgi:uncharacterized protein (TIGR02001 family)